MYLFYTPGIDEKTRVLLVYSGTGVKNGSIGLEWVKENNVICLLGKLEPFKRQPHKVVKHTQAVRNELFECAWPICGVGA